MMSKYSPPQAVCDCSPAATVHTFSGRFPVRHNRSAASVQIQPLESRRLLSAAGLVRGHPEFDLGAALSDPTIVADREKLKDDVQQYRQDRADAAEALAADHKALAAELKVFGASDDADDAELASLRKDLRSDL